MIFILLPLPPQRFKYRHRRFNPFLTSFYQICYCQFITLGYNKVLLNTICKSWLNRLDDKLFAVRAPSFCDLPSELFYRRLGFLLIPISIGRTSRWVPLGHVGVLSLKRSYRHVLHIVRPMLIRFVYHAPDEAHPVCVSHSLLEAQG
jgi:hypothetical protein